jgi:Protein of unknown function (DUF3486)
METQQQRKPRRPPHEIGALPAKVRKELDERIAKREFKGYRELKHWLALNGCQIATLAVRHHALKLDGKIEAVRLATAQARAVVGASDDDDGDMNQALMRLVQQHLFTVLVDLQGAELSEVNLGSLARSVATLARATVAQQKYADTMRMNVLAAQRTVADAEARGLTEVGVAQIKRVLMEITR